MRRGEVAAAWGIGGAWQCAIRTLDGESKTCDALDVGGTATKAGEKDKECVAAGCIKGACVDAMVSQHSWLCSWLCDEHGIVLQHCIAASGVDIAKQSNAYVAKAIAITPSIIGLAKRIRNQARRVVDGSQGRMALSSGAPPLRVLRGARPVHYDRK
jgi:hypothetical protein